MTTARSTSLGLRVLRLIDAAPDSALALILANLVPLAGVLFLGWSLGAILVVYWLESGVIGLLNVPKMLLARGPLTVQREGFSLRVPILVGGAPSLAAKLFAALFFIIHYGIFWLGHGLFVFLIATMARTRAGLPVPLDSTDPFASAGIDPGWAAVAVVVLFASHLVSLWRNFVGRREYLSVSPIQQMAAPYRRVVLMHLTILGGAVLTELIGTPVAAVVVLVMLKTGVDLRAHLLERTRAAQRTTAIID